MEYKDIRKKFVELSGRYDLVNADWTDNGADFFLNAGQMRLDSKADIPKGTAKNVQSIVAGTTIIKTVGLRTVKELWMGTSADGLIKITKAPSLAWMKEEYGSQLSSITQGTPEYYYPVGLRPYPDAVLAATWLGYYDIDDMILGDTHYTYQGVVIAPPADQTYYYSLVGLFYSPTLSATLAAGVWTQTKSYWSEVHPDLLLEAALYKLEVFYRNTEGAKDWKGAMDDDLQGMDKDVAEEEAADINQMEG